MLTDCVRLNVGQHVAAAQRITQSLTTGDAFGTAQLGSLQHLQGGRPQMKSSGLK
jgi:hypothetical protein